MQEYPRTVITYDSFTKVDQAIYIPPTHPPHEGNGRYGKLINIDLSPINDEWSLDEHDEYLRTAHIDSDQMRVVNFDPPCLYLGVMHRHFGHFIIESLSRIWWSLREHKTIQFLAHDNNWNDGQSFANVWNDTDGSIRQILDVIGVTKDNLTMLNEFCIVTNVIVPKPNITLMQPQMNQYCSHSYKNMMQRIGAQLSDNSPSNTNSHPLYLSRRKLYGVPDEVRHFEWLIEERLRPYADIMYPEDIKLNYQIKEVNSRKYIIGKIGTALHLALFCNGGKRFSVLVDRIVTPGSLSYFAALDGLYENSASYVEHLTNGTQYEAERVADQLLFNLYK